MSTKALDTIIKDGAIRSLNYFNGRLLSAEDLTREQQAHQTGRLRLGQAVGAGITCGLEVVENQTLSDLQIPVVTVKPGRAINRTGQTLVLQDPVDLALVQPVSITSPGGSSDPFAPCQPLQGGVYITGKDVYLLTMASAAAGEGLATVSGLGNNGSADCQVSLQVEGIQFRLLELDIDNDLLQHPSTLRNLVAYHCFGPEPLPAPPLAAEEDVYGLLDDLRKTSLSDCDVPLALLYWTTSGGIEFIDLWAVRRRLIEPEARTTWVNALGDRRLAEAEAMLLQFQEQLLAVQGEGSQVAAKLKAKDRFRFLPPSGYLPLGENGFDWPTFLDDLAPSAITQVDGAFFREIWRRSLFQEPIDLQQSPALALRVYQTPGEEYVLFARSDRSRLRIRPSPILSTANLPAPPKITAIDRRNVHYPYASAQGSYYAIEELPPGAYQVEVQAQGYKPATLDDVTLVAGRALDRDIILERLPNGSIHLAVFDQETRKPLSTVSRVTAVGPNATRRGVRSAKSHIWILEDLPNGHYRIKITATGYQTKTIDSVDPVQAGQQLEMNANLIPQEVERVQPDRCIVVKGMKSAVWNNAKLCMILPDSRIKYTLHEALSQPDAIAGQIWWQKPGRPHIADRYKATLYETIRPWRGMVSLADPLPQALAEWLAAWQEWFTIQAPNKGIEKSHPMIVVYSDYTPPKNPREVPDDPQAYAIFGDFGVPLTITHKSITTRRPYDLGDLRIPGFGEDLKRDVNNYGVYKTDTLSGAWGNLIVEATGEPLEYARYLVMDAVNKAEEINNSRTYYDDVDTQVNEALNAEGYKDDVAIANADVETLGSIVGSNGFALRLIRQAREFVPQDSWSVRTAGFSAVEEAALADAGISSMGGLARAADTDEGKNRIADSLGLKGQPDKVRDEAVEDLYVNVLGQLTARSLAALPEETVLDMDTIPATTKRKLLKEGLNSAADIAAADDAKLAEITGLSTARTTRLKEEAVEKSRVAVDVSRLASIDPTVAKSLADNDLGTIGKVSNADLARVSSAFGGKQARARAVVNAINVAYKRG